MNEIEIKAHLHSLYISIINSFKNEGIKNIIKNSYVAGGAIRDLYRNKLPNDYDIYFRTEEDSINFTKLINEYYNHEEISKKYPILVNVQETSITISVNYDELNKATVQFILNKNYTGEPDEVIDRFDFTINMNFYEFYNGNLYCNYEDLNNRYLNFNYGSKPNISRLLRFLNEGYVISPIDMYNYIQHVIKTEKDNPNLLKTKNLYGKNTRFNF